MIDTGQGVPLVLLPGIQGRWEWMAPAIEALARRCRTISFSASGEKTSGFAFDESIGFDNFVAQIDAVLDRCGVRRTAICGVSFSGLVAVHYAAARPERVSALVLASALPPTWRPDERVRGYLDSPRLGAPLFVARSPGRVGPEIMSAIPTWRGRLAFSARQTLRVARAPFSARLMVQRVRLIGEADLLRDCSRIVAPTLVITGEEGLDRVVPVAMTREYARLIPGTRLATIERTGHIGMLTRPDRFAELVGGFAVEHAAEDHRPHLDRLRA